MSRNKIIYSLLFFVLSNFGCSTKKNLVQLNSLKHVIEVKMRSSGIDFMQNLIQVKLSIKSLNDSIKIDAIEIEHPSFLTLQPNIELSPFKLVKGEAQSIVKSYGISKTESFKLKGIIHATYKETNKISEISYLYFYYTDGEYLISDNINDIIGKRRKNGEEIKMEDLRIFNKTEVEDININNLK